MRSGGLQLYVDGRGATVIDAIQQSKAFNQALESGGVQPRPFYAEDLVRGYRLDVWESRTGKWHSLHRRKGTYAIGEEDLPFNTEDEEGFFQLAPTQPAPGAPSQRQGSLRPRDHRALGGLESQRALPGQGAEPACRSRQSHPARR